MKRTFTKYPSSYVKADSEIYKVSDNPTVYTNLNFGDMYAELDKDYATTPNAKKFISDSIDTHLRYRLITKAEADALRAKYLGDDVSASTCVKASSYEGRPHWHAIAEFSDGTTLEFDKAYNANGNYSLENEEQYSIESELLTKATDTGKEVTFYSVDFVEE